MHYSLFCESDETAAYLFEEYNSFFLRKFPFDFEIFLKVWVAQFLDDIIVVAAFHDIHDSHDVFWLQHLHDLYFWEEGALQIVIVINWI